MSSESSQRQMKPLRMVAASVFMLSACSPGSSKGTYSSPVAATASTSGHETTTTQQGALDIVAFDRQKSILIAYHPENNGSLSFDFVSPTTEQIIELARYVCQDHLIRVVPGVQLPGTMNSSLPGEYIALVNEAKVNALKPGFCADNVMSREDAVQIAA